MLGLDYQREICNIKSGNFAVYAYNPIKQENFYSKPTIAISVYCQNEFFRVYH